MHASFGLWQRVRALVRAHRAQLRFCLRMTVAGLAAFAIAQALTIPLHGLWVVLTAVVVMQMSAGGSLRATVQYLVGTLGGAVYAGIVGVLIPHTTVLSQAGVLALTIAPLALAAAVNPNFRVAPVSGVLVLLISGQLGEGPIESAVTRVFEVALGGAVAVTVSLLVFPERAHRLGVRAAVRIVEQFARVLPKFLAGFAHKLDAEEIRRIQDDLGAAVASFQAIAAEAEHERLVRLLPEADPGPLSRALLRLRHDLVIIGRAAATPLPESVALRLEPLLSRLGAAASDFLRGCAGALARRGKPPALDAVDAALAAYTAEIESLRSEGVTRALSGGELEQLFALGFALDQLRRNFTDLQRCAQENARKSSAPAK